MRATRSRPASDRPPQARRIWGAASGLLAVLVAGCGGGLDLIPVSGTVTLDGKPVDGAAVVFVPVAGGPVASGTTEAGGKFRLMTINDAGAVPGEHHVTVTKQTMHGITADGMPGPGGIRIEWHVPERYSKPKTSGLTAAVSRSQNEFEFDLSSQ